MGGEIVENQITPQGRPGRNYSEMLLRQHPWLKDQLSGAEYPVAISYRKPETLFGAALVFIGCFVVLDTLFHLDAFGGVLQGLLLVLAGTVTIYSGVWALFFVKRSYVLVTSERMVYQKINLLGQPGKAICVPRSQIQRARFLKSTVMYRVKRNDGGISIVLKNGKTILISSVRDAESILGALG